MAAVVIGKFAVRREVSDKGTILIVSLIFSHALLEKGAKARLTIGQILSPLKYRCPGREHETLRSIDDLLQLPYNARSLSEVLRRRKSQ
jgi:hypothetical protein